MTVNEFLLSSNLSSTDSRILLQYAAGLSAADIIAHPDRVLEPDQILKLTELADKRKTGFPVEYIVGKKEFYKDTFKVRESVLIPQPDTEILVEEAVRLAEKSEKKSFRILDLCAGTGCIGISVAKEIVSRFDSFEILFADISETAVQCCTENCSNLLKGINYRIIQGDLFEKLNSEKFNMILTNPPYIPTNVISTLDSEVQHEPNLALDGGASGLEIIERIITQAPDMLLEDGYILMEIGYDQGQSVSSLFKAANLKEVSVIKDLGTRDRVVKGRV